MMHLTCAELLIRGDVAAASGDHDQLEQVAMLLSERVGDPLADALGELARDCRKHAPLARKAWPMLRREIAHRISIAGT